MIGPRKLLLAMIFIICCLPAAATTRYIAQGAGTFSGGTACNGQTAITPATWNATSESAGDISYVCGTITGSGGSTVLTFSWNGSSGNPIQLIFDTGASLQAPYFNSSGAINVNAHTFITINGGTNGFIEATANGTSGSNACPSGSCSNQQNSQGVENVGNNDIVENLGVYNMYVHTSTSDEAFDTLSIDCIDTGKSGVTAANVTITGNTVHDCLTGIGFWFGTSGGSNYTVSNNTISRTCWGMDIIEGAGTYPGIYIFGNKVYDHSNWADNSAACHSNGLHLFQANACSSCVVNGLYLYNNEWDGPNDAADTTVGGVQMDNNGGNAGVTNGYMFNNVFSWASTDCGSTCDAQLGLWTGSGWGIYNNTFIGNATGSAVGAPLMSDDQSGVTLSFKNNLLTTSNTLMHLDTGLMLSGSPNYNVYANGGSPGGGATCSFGSNFSAWQSCIGSAGDANSRYYATNPLPLCNSTTDCSNAKPQAGSTAIGAGTNLYSICNGQPNPGLGALCFDKAGVARPSNANWDAGAFQSGASQSGCSFAGHSYSTSFASPPAPENPIREGCTWLDGAADGTNWQNVQTVSGKAFGNQQGSAGSYDDSEAILTGTWGPNQTAQATVFCSGASGGQEVELRLHSTISPGVSNGYEINYLCATSGGYNQIVRWNGPLGNFTYVSTTCQLSGGACGVKTGDVIKATIDGSGNIVSYINGVQSNSGTDTTYAGGSPGIGFWRDATDTTNSDFGLTSFSATDGGADTLAPPTNLAATVQ